MGLTGGRGPAGTGNSAPSNRMLRAEHGAVARIGSLTSLRDIQLEEARLIESRSRKVTVCLICLIASISCLSPFISLHLTQRVGLLLFESDLIQLRSSLFTVIICLLVLVIVYTILFFTDIKPDRKSLMIQKLFKQLMGAFAIISAISYLAIVLIVPQIKQIQRMPLATFDCNANLITIENCQQQFTTKGGEQTLPEAINELLSGDLNGNSERLIKKLNCLKYNDKDLDALQVPTRFLLHKCGLVCKPQRQQSHQFGDDLNQNQNYPRDWSTTTPKLPERNIANTKITLESINSPSDVPGVARQQHRPLIPPYHNDLVEPQNGGAYLNHLTYTHNASSVSQDDQFQSSNKAIYGSGPDEDTDNHQQRQVSLKVCFSGEFSGGSNYKQFCITNLANNALNQDHTLTIGQLNAMLRKFMPSPSDMSSTNPSHDASHATDHMKYAGQVNEIDQNSQYMNPVVQFESHFKNWPHLARSSLNQPFSGTGLDESLFGGQVINTEGENVDQEGWCSFRPIPPFIVNNKPFSDIQCSLEHEYTMTTGPSLDSISFNGRGSDKIYLKKSSAESGTGSITRERCNIQCKVNILYQVHMSRGADGTSKRSSNRRRDSSATVKERDGSSSMKDDTNDDDLHYYLPLKPCLIVSDDGDKTTTSNYYLLFRSIGDSALVLTFILLDLFLFIESIDTKQFQLEAKKVRLIGLLVIIALMPLLIAFLFDLISVWYPNQSYNKTRKEGYLTSFLSDKVIPSFIDLFSSSTGSSSSSSTKTRRVQAANTDQSASSKLNYSNPVNSYKVSNESDYSTSSNINSKRSSMTAYQLDNYMVPFFIYSTLMFALAINSFALPLVGSTAPLVRVSSTEELGMASGSTNKLERNTSAKTARKQSKSDQQQQAATTGTNSSGSRTQFELKSNQLYRKQTSKMISLSLVALFLGTQFNLSQLTQTNLFFDSLSHSSSNPMQNAQSFASFWFVLQSHSSAAIFVLLLATLFIEEASTFFGGLSPFKSATSAYSTSEELRKNRARFLNYTTISLLTYSFRFYTIASLSPDSSLKWLMAFLFQLAELFNFPLTWFALTTRAHEIVLEYKARHKLLTESLSVKEAEVEGATEQKQIQVTKLNSAANIAQQPNKHYGSENGTRALTIHLLVQSAAAFTYFVLARSFALFVHSLNASLHLHSDNVDWFIMSFHQQEQQQRANGNHHRQREPQPTIGAVHGKQNISVDGQHQQQQPQQQQPSSSSASASPTSALNGGKLPPESLFSPLPGERQTYLHASRLFLRYNSLLCLLIGLLLLAALIYVKYQIWADQRRTLEVHQTATGQQQSGTDDGNIGDRLSLDLMQIHSAGQAANARAMYPPKPASRLSTLTTSSSSLAAAADKTRTRPRSPRAKILFHYNLDRRDSSSSSLESSLVPPATFAESRNQVTRRQHEQAASAATTGRMGGSRPSSANELIIPIEIVGAQEEDDGEIEATDEDQHFPATQVGDQVIERITKHRNKRVRIFEDSESWPNEEREQSDTEQDDHLALNNPEFKETQHHQQRARPTERDRKRKTISFAPTATLIGHDGSFSELRRASSANVRMTIQRASPEPSIDNEPGFEQVESD